MHKIPIANCDQQIAQSCNWQSEMLIVGLGNPGEEYAWSRHNLGFMLIDKLASDAGIAVSRRECSSFVGRGEIEGVKTKLAKPQTFMNLSGHAVSCLLAKVEERVAGRSVDRDFRRSRFAPREDSHS